jgi:hypothetical protein
MVPRPGGMSAATCRSAQARPRTRRRPPRPGRQVPHLEAGSRRGESGHIPAPVYETPK